MKGLVGLRRSLASVATVVRWTEIARGVLRFATTMALASFVLSGALFAYSFTLPLPKDLGSPSADGLRILDRNGQLLARLRTQDDVWQESILPGEVGPHTFAVLIAAEDARFWSHPGVDPLAIGRAALQAATHGRIVSGASTITQQLARSCFARPRNLWGKLQEIALALRIERSMGKREILLAYLNRVHFGPRIVGMAAASDHYLGKPLTALDLGETALLLAAVRGPSVYDLERHLARARERRDVILERAAQQGLVPVADVRLALSTPAVLRPRAPWPGAWHLTRRLAKQHSGEEVVHSTVDLTLQRRVEELARLRQKQLQRDGVSAVALVVLNSKSADVLAYVGSHDVGAERDLGQNDGAASARQPGSALKPLLYATAIDELGLDASSIVPDEPLTFRTPRGHYTPDNYDRRYRGPVTLSRALASSLNVPAVFVLDRLGVARGLAALHEFGLASLDRGAQHYGLGLALGGGEVSLLELTAAYSALARGGSYLDPRLTKDQEQPPQRQVVSPHAAEVITRILQDEQARTEMFGPRAPEATTDQVPFALKTGTSSGFRDAWAFAYDSDITVGVWVGNFDGRPMVRTSGAVGAAPLAVEALSEARALWGSVALPVTFMSGTAAEVAGEPAPFWTARPRITFPADGARLQPRRLGQTADIVVRTMHPPTGSRLSIDGQIVELLGDRAPVSVDAGRHQACLIDAGGVELSSVTFDIIAPG